MLRKVKAFALFWSGDYGFGVLRTESLRRPPRGFSGGSMITSDQEIYAATMAVTHDQFVTSP
jgi:hypothetical protein